MSVIKMLDTIEESNSLGKIHPPFNSNFISNIPKERNPLGFEHYRPISLQFCLQSNFKNHHHLPQTLTIKAHIPMKILTSWMIKIFMMS
jgi:hypothetical protein